MLLTAIGLLIAAAGINRLLSYADAGHTRASGPASTGGIAPVPWANALRTHPSPMPPSVAFSTLFLGGFRGLIADGLWIRASILQEQGRYFELVQLADWITALEPEFPQVWAFQAWNMAYNVSVLMPDDQDRWRWVRNGMELLRDRALPATGQSPEINIEIGLLFQHKIGGDGDEQADYFKQRWVQEFRPYISADGTMDSTQATSLEAMLRMDPAIMQKVVSRFGSLDWRVPESHAVYWAFSGLLQEPDTSTAVLCRRIIYQSMAALFESGSLTEDRATGILVFSPAFKLLPGVIGAFEDAMLDDPAAASGFIQFLARAIHLLMFYQHRTDAETLFTMLHTRFPTPETEAGFEAFTRRRQTFLPRIIQTKP
jgi:hypothetical protein